MGNVNCKQPIDSTHPKSGAEYSASEACLLEPGLSHPDPYARARSRKLSQQLKAEIVHTGPMPFSRYMDRVLYTPELGYYCAEAPKFGPTGDFLTAPEISPLFARCLARPIANALRQISANEVLELGAGSGKLAAELLETLAEGGHPLTRYLILEPSAALRRRQESTLRARVPSLVERVSWLENLPNSTFRGVILANEVLDAMPASRFRIVPEGVREWYVGWGSGGFTWTLGHAADSRLEQAVTAIELDIDQRLPLGYDSEVNLNHTPWVRALGQCLGAGLILLVDYGYGRREYYHPQRDTGTLVCYYRHHAHDDPLLFPGLQDISVHVDFTTIAEAAAGTGLDIAGFTTQANFLLATGLTEFLAQVNTRGARYHAWVRQAKRLILPGEMGELVKVMALTRGISAPLPGFECCDLGNRL